MCAAEMKRKILEFVDEGGSLHLAYVAVKVAKEQKRKEDSKKELVESSSKNS